MNWIRFSIVFHIRPAKGFKLVIVWCKAFPQHQQWSSPLSAITGASLAFGSNFLWREEFPFYYYMSLSVLGGRIFLLVVWGVGGRIYTRDKNMKYIKNIPIDIFILFQIESCLSQNISFTSYPLVPLYRMKRESINMVLLGSSAVDITKCNVIYQFTFRKEWRSSTRYIK